MYYRLTEEQAKDIIQILENVPIQGNRKERKAFDDKIDKIISSLNKPIDITDDN